MRVNFSETPVVEKVSPKDVPYGTLLRLDHPEDSFHGNIYLKVVGCSTLVNLTSGGTSHTIRTDKYFIKLPAGFTATLVQE
jgi:hypothetical protein